MCVEDYYKVMDVAEGGKFLTEFAERFNERTGLWQMDVVKAHATLEYDTDYRINLHYWTDADGEVYDFLQLDAEQDVAGVLGDITDWASSLLDDYDVSYETYACLGDDGHGVNGAPYELEDVLELKKAVKSALRRLVSDIEHVIAENYRLES